MIWYEYNSLPPDGKWKMEIKSNKKKEEIYPPEGRDNMTKNHLNEK